MTKDKIERDGNIYMKFYSLPKWIRELLKLKCHMGMRNELLYNVAVAYREQLNKVFERKIQNFNKNHIKPELSETEVKIMVKSVLKNSSWKCTVYPSLKEVLQKNNIKVD